MFQLRGHHLFCLVGYRGIGYSEEFSNNMTKVHQQIRSNPKTQIEIVNGPDCLCEKYPKSKEYHCENQYIYERDLMILKILHLEIGQIITWKEVEQRIKQFATPSIIHSVCKTCSWKSLGYCEEGIQRICSGESLIEVK